MKFFQKFFQWIRDFWDSCKLNVQREEEEAEIRLKKSLDLETLKALKEKKRELERLKSLRGK